MSSAQPPLILASASPRRRQLLEQIGFIYERDFTVQPADVSEELDAALPPAEAVVALALRKAGAVAREAELQTWVLGCDTLVYLPPEDEPDGSPAARRAEALGKPADADDARRILRALSGRTHQVWSGIALLQPAKAGDPAAAFSDERPALTRAVQTEVRFRNLTEAEIDAYLASGEPFDKAGAYGIQGRGALFVASIAGDYSNVVGLPLCALGEMLREAGFALP